MAQVLTENSCRNWSMDRREKSKKQKKNPKQFFKVYNPIIFFLPSCSLGLKETVTSQKEFNINSAFYLQYSLFEYLAKKKRKEFISLN